MTAVTGGLRMASSDHYASDVLFGHITGYLSGYLYPTLLYYQQFRSKPEDPDAHAARTAIIPIVTPRAAQLSIVGSF